MNHALVTASIFQTIGHSISTIFHPLLVLFATILSWIYGVIPNYALAISALTLVIMAILTPLTVKSTKSQLAMQRIQPEMKKLQLKYKGSTDKVAMNEEMMALYKEHGVNPLSGCLPVLAQAPFMSVLYFVIRGLTHSTVLADGTTKSSPQYIPHSSAMYHDLVASNGHMVSFGVDLSNHPFSPGLTVVQRIPLFALIAAAVGLQYVLMWQIKKNTQAGNAAPAQMQTIQRIMPLLFAYIYFIVPAALTVYFVVSNIVRVITQDLMFRTGVVKRPHHKASERVISGTAKEEEPPKGSSKSGKPALEEPKKDGSKEHPRSKDKRKRRDR
ncbi:MAG: YidC/Oxa1 family membrane protein insertase [Actinomycetota bacterium]